MPILLFQKLLATSEILRPTHTEDQQRYEIDLSRDTKVKIEEVNRHPNFLVLLTELKIYLDIA
jgi:hypothetical protein